MFNGLNSHMGNLSQLSNAVTRSISPENYTGEKGKGGWMTIKNSRQSAEPEQRIISVAFWYQTLPTVPFPQLGDKDNLEVI